MHTRPSRVFMVILDQGGLLLHLPSFLSRLPSFSLSSRLFFLAPDFVSSPFLSSPKNTRILVPINIIIPSRSTIPLDRRKMEFINGESGESLLFVLFEVKTEYFCPRQATRITSTFICFDGARLPCVYTPMNSPATRPRPVSPAKNLDS